ncbi:MAG: hypothetical protein PWP74_1349, partial [Shewanella sp.]|nr:hypothetical protein [Shewanella sp.]
PGRHRNHKEVPDTLVMLEVWTEISNPSIVEP